MAIDIRRLTTNDIGTCGIVIHEAFSTLAARHAFPPDFPSAEAAAGLAGWLLTRANVRGVVAVLDGRIVGCNFIDLAPPVAGIGPIAVAPSAEGNGIGGALMRAVMDLASNAGITDLRLAQAAYNNASLSLYTKLGFRAQAPLSVLQGPPIGATIEGHELRDAEADDISTCGQICRAVLGYERADDVAAAIADGTAQVVRAHGRVVGYTTGVGFAGHTVAAQNDGLKALIAGASAFAGPGFILPSTNHDVLRWCLAHGLRLVMQMTYMSTAACATPDHGWMPSILR